MGRGLDGGPESGEVALPLPDPLELPRQQQDEGDLHDLRRLDGHGHPVELDPGLVAVTLPAEGHQQADEAHVEGEEPLPMADELLRIHHGEDEVGKDAEAHGHGLDQEHLQGVGAVHVAGAAVDQHQAEERGPHAQAQQHQVRLLEEVPDGIFQSVSHGSAPFRIVCGQRPGGFSHQGVKP